PTGNICDYSPHRKELLLLILAVDISYDVRYHSGNTLRFPRVTREPPRTIVLWCLTLATIPAGQGQLLSDTSHAEKAVFFFKESSCISLADLYFSISSHFLLLN